MKTQDRLYFDPFREVVKAVNSTLDLQKVLNLLVFDVTKTMDLKACIIRLDAMEGKTVSIYNAPDDPRVQYPKEVTEEGIASILSVPMHIKGRVIGVMRLLTSEPREFSEDEINFAEALAEIGAIAIENARMYERIKQDYEKARETSTALWDTIIHAR
jgi:GAF domain-containing protein